MMRVAFRTDASVDIGSGHVMRCLTLAEKLRQKGAEVAFICRQLPGHGIDLIRSYGFSVSVLPPPSMQQNPAEQTSHWLYVPWQQDAEQTHQVLATAGHWNWLIVDHYGIDAAWEEYQKSVVSQIMVIDDLADRVHSCDVLLDQNLYTDMESRYSNKVPVECQQLLGLRYVLLRDEFIKQRENLKAGDGSVRNILVFFGGVDAPNMTQKVVAAIADLNIADISVNVVIGSANPHKDKLEALCLSLPDVQLHVQAANMAEMMANADLCVGAGGTATWERCGLGLPALAWPIADNQKKLLHDAAAMGLVYAPDFDCPPIENIALHLQALMENALLRRHIATRCLEAVDCQGAGRVVSRLVSVDVILRKATMDDMQKVYNWRNHIDIRKCSRNNGEIDFQQHQRWFREVLDDQDRLLLIGSVDKRDVAVLRYDIDNNEAEVSVFLAPDEIGRGYGKALLAAGEKYIVTNRPDVESVIAEVMAENKVSQKLFESSGYALNAMQYIKRF